MLRKIKFGISVLVALLMVLCLTAGPASTATKKDKAPPQNKAKAAKGSIDPYANLRTKITSAREKTKAIQEALKKGKLLAEDAGKQVDDIIANVQLMLSDIDKDSEIQRDISEMATFYTERQKVAKENIKSGKGNKSYWNDSLKDWQDKSAELGRLRDDLNTLIAGMKGKIEWMKEKKPEVVDLYLRALAAKVNEAIAEMITEVALVDEELGKWNEKADKISKMPR